MTGKGPPGTSITTSSEAPGTCPVLQLVGSVQLPPAAGTQNTASSTVISPASVAPPPTGTSPRAAPVSTAPPSARLAVTFSSPNRLGTSEKLKKPAASAVVVKSTTETRTSAPAAGVPSSRSTKPSTVVSGSPSETNRATAALAPSLLAVMKTDPSATAVTRPSGPTVAMAGLLDW